MTMIKGVRRETRTAQTIVWDNQEGHEDEEGGSITISRDTNGDLQLEINSDCDSGNMTIPRFAIPEFLEALQIISTEITHEPPTAEVDLQSPELRPARRRRNRH